MYGIIYKATSPDGRVYIGQTIENLTQRKKKHKARAKYKDVRTLFHIALLDIGFSAFIWEQIDTAETAEELDRKEKYWIAHYDSTNPDNGFNDRSGGIHEPLSENHRNNIRKALKGRKRPLEVCEKISNSKIGKPSGMKGKKQSEEHKRKISEAQRGEKGHSVKLTENQVRQIKDELKRGIRICDITRKYNVSRGCIYDIKSGRNWAYLHEVCT